MTQFKFKNLPNGFDFPLTKHEVREFIKTSAANFETVEFAGFSSSESYYNQKNRGTLQWSYDLKAKFRESEWFFELTVNDLRSQYYEGRRE